MLKKLLVTGSGGSAATNFIRSLRLSGEKFYIVGADSSKYHAQLSQAEVTYLLPDCHDKDYLNKLSDIVKKEKIQLIHCQPDPEVKYLSDHRSKFKGKVYLPSKKAVDIAQDKFAFYKVMRDAHVPVPLTYKVQNPFNLEKILEQHNCKLWLRAGQGAGSLAALPVQTFGLAFNWIEYWCTKGLSWDDFIISEFLPGKEYAFQSLWENGKLITSAARQRIEYLFQNRMPSGQSSTPTVAKSVHNLMVNAVATKAVIALDKNATGIFCVDLKEDKQGIPNVTEINVGRFFTTSYFFAKAGSNMPYYYVKMAFGEKIPHQPQYDAVPKDYCWIRQIDCKEALTYEVPESVGHSNDKRF
jgi:carbamoyl-phosphate synthase large subunit